MKPQITNVRVNPHRAGSYGAICDSKGARYHVWFNPDTFQLEQPTLFKNPPSGTKHRGDGWFDTRRLNPTNKANAALIAEMFDQIKANGLIEAANQEKAEKDRAEELRSKELIKTSREQELGPKMRTQLQGIMDKFIDGSLCLEDFDETKALFELIDGKDQEL